MKKISVGAIILLILIAVFLFKKTDILPDNLVGEGVKLYRVALSGDETDRVYVHVPFVADSEVVRHINVGLDLNDNGVIDTDSDEWIVQNAVPLITAGENLRFPAHVPDHKVGRDKPVEVVFFYSKDPLSAEVIQRNEGGIDFTSERAIITEVKIDDMEVSLSIDEEGNKRTGVVTDTLSEFSFVPVTYAEGENRPEYYSAKHEGVPDQDQEYNECSPTSVANSFTWLAQKYGFEDLMPEDIGSTITELKADLEWDSGTKDEDIIKGKQLFVERHNLPIEVHQIGTQNDPDIHYKIYEEMQKGQAVEVSLQFYTRDEHGNKKRSGGHMVTVTGVSGGPAFKGITFSDSATESDDEGSGDMYSMAEGNKLKWFWTDKEVEIEYAYAQSPIQSVIDGTWTMPSGTDFLVNNSHVLNPGGDVVTKGISRFGFFNTFIDHPGDHYVGDTFTVSATVVMRDGERQYMFWTDDEGARQAYWHAATNPWTLNGIMTGGGVLSPGRLVGRPSITRVNGDRYRVEQTYQCLNPGIAKVTYEAQVTWTVEDNGELPADVRERYEDQLKPQATITIDSPLFKCLTKDPSQIKEEPAQTAIPEPRTVCGITEDSAGQEIEVLVLGEECFPKSQFHIGGAMDPCKAEHWHAGTAYSLTGVEQSDPNPNACGFGKVTEVTIDTVKIDVATAAKFLGDIFQEEPVPEPEYEITGLENSYKAYGDNWQYGGELDYKIEIKGE